MADLGNGVFGRSKAVIRCVKKMDKWSQEWVDGAGAGPGPLLDGHQRAKHLSRLIWQGL